MVLWYPAQPIAACLVPLGLHMVLEMALLHLLYLIFGASLFVVLMTVEVQIVGVHLALLKAGTFTDIRVRLNTIFTATGAFTGSTGATSGDNGSGGAATVNFAFDASNVVNTATETRPRNIALLYCIKI